MVVRWSLLACTLVTLSFAVTHAPPVSARTTHTESHFIEKGIFDDAQILYGDPDVVFPTLAKLGTRVIRVTLWWGGPNGVAARRPAHPSNPLDAAYNWDTYDRTVEYAAKYGITTIFTVLGTPGWEDNGRGWNVAPDHATD